MDNLYLAEPDDLFKLFGKSVAVFQTQVPDCDLADEIFVEYQSNIHQFKLIRSGLKLSETEILEPGTFCIDGIVDFAGNSTKPEIRNGIIVRTCRPREMCKKIPCVRRCCRNEEMMQRVNGSVKCVEYARNINPTFYDIESPLHGLTKGYSIVEPQGNFFCIYFESQFVRIRLCITYGCTAMPKIELKF